MTACRLPVLPVLQFSGLFPELGNPHKHWARGVVSSQFSTPLSPLLKLFFSWSGVVGGRARSGTGKETGRKPAWALGLRGPGTSGKTGELGETAESADLKTPGQSVYARGSAA
jgi:hypothetical protein